MNFITIVALKVEEMRQFCQFRITREVSWPPSLLAFHSLLNFFISMREVVALIACHVGSPLRWGCGVWCHAKPRGCSSKTIQYYTKNRWFLFARQNMYWHFLSDKVQFTYSKPNVQTQYIRCHTKILHANTIIIYLTLHNNTARRQWRGRLY
jgi:hypothetical protein